MKTLFIRTISAVVAVLIIAIAYYFLADNGLKLLIGVAVVVITLELNRLFFKTQEPLFILRALPIASIGVFLVSVYFPVYSGLALAIGVLFTIRDFLVHSRKGSPDLTTLFHSMAKVTLGIVYVGLLPSFIFRLFDLPRGSSWFFCLLIVVFVGDTIAYLVGSRWGRNKLLPLISPQKSVEGAIGGLLGSIISAMVFGYLLFETSPIWKFVIMGAVAGFLAQCGDLFESLIKRLADRKDSGNIMPGHGGVLDRIDGILFAGPVIFVFAEWLGN